MLGNWAFYTFLKNNGWLPKKSIIGQHVFITGAGSGLGRLMALRIAKLGGKLSLVDLNLEGLNETNRLIQESTNGANVNVQKLDISIREDVSKVMSQC